MGISTMRRRAAGAATKNGRPAARTEPIDHVQRKQDHLRIVVDEAVSALGVTTGIERYRLVHRALPELDLIAIDTRIAMISRTTGRSVGEIFISLRTSDYGLRFSPKTEDRRPETED